MEQAVSVKKAVKRGLTQRLRDKVGMGDSDSSSSASSDSEDEDGERMQNKRKSGVRRKPLSRKSTVESDTADTLRDDAETDGEHGSSGSNSRKRTRFRVGRKKKEADIEMGVRDQEERNERENGEESTKVRMGSLSLPKASFGRWEQSMPADAVLTKQGADEVCLCFGLSLRVLLMLYRSFCKA